MPAVQPIAESGGVASYGAQKSPKLETGLQLVPVGQTVVPTVHGSPQTSELPTVMLQVLDGVSSEH